ncbi:MAG: hypothetical protein GXP35_01085 [Actinobacteria bacterium]|nr:hypothetical protein [Actinomycetota bacterium]
MKARRTHRGGRALETARPRAALLILVVLSLVAASVGSFGPVSAAASDPTVALVSWPEGDGYLVVSRSGRLWTFGSAVGLGSPADLDASGVDLVAVATRSAADGYWMFGSDGGVFAYGDAAFHGWLCRCATRWWVQPQLRQATVIGWSLPTVEYLHTATPFSSARPPRCPYDSRS